MKKNPFTFVVLTYNSDKFILENLESIKYQILHYGNDRDVSLIVSDDCSSDKTKLLVSKWLDINKNLFYSHNFFQHESNHGIAFNYSYALRNVTTDLMKTIDGDDVFSSIDIMSEIEKLSDSDMAVFFPIRFDNDKFFWNKDEREEFYYYYKKKGYSNSESVKIIETFKPFITPEVSVRRRYYDEDCFNFLTNFSQFEDDPSLYHILKNHSEIVLHWINKPLVLYRVHSASLSNGVGSYQQLRFLFDLHFYRKWCLKKERNLFFKLILLFMTVDTFLMKHLFNVSFSVYRKISSFNKKNAVNRANSYSSLLQFISDTEKLKNEQIKYLKEIQNSVNKSGLLW